MVLPESHRAGSCPNPPAAAPSLPSKVWSWFTTVTCQVQTAYSENPIRLHYLASLVFLVLGLTTLNTLKPEIEHRRLARLSDWEMEMKKNFDGILNGGKVLAGGAAAVVAELENKRFRKYTIKKEVPCEGATFTMHIDDVKYQFDFFSQEIHHKHLGDPSPTRYQVMCAGREDAFLNIVIFNQYLNAHMEERLQRGKKVGQKGFPAGCANLMEVLLQYQE